MPQEGTLMKPCDTGATDTDTSDSGTCQRISQLLSRIGDKWTLLIVRELGQGPLRFSDLKRRLGSISQKMLTLTLRNLERDGMVARSVQPTAPPRVDYALTPMGHDLARPIAALADWTINHADQIDAARARYDKGRG